MVWGYLSLRNNARKNKDLIALIPDNAALIVEFHNLKTLSNKLQSKNDSSLSKYLLSLNYFKSALDFYKKVTNKVASESSVLHAIGSNDVYLSFYKLKDKKLGYFFTIQLPNDIDRKSIYNFVEKSLDAKLSADVNGDLLKLTDRAGTVYFAYYINNVLSISNDDLLLKNSWLKISDQNQKISSPPFAKLLELSNEFADVSIYYHSKYAKEVCTSEILNLIPPTNSNIYSWASADFDVDDQLAFANGFIQSSTRKMPECGRFQMGEFIPANISKLSWNYRDEISSSEMDSNNFKLKLSDIFTNEVANISLNRFGKINHKLNYLLCKLKPEKSLSQFFIQQDSAFQWHHFIDSTLMIKSNFFKCDSIFKCKEFVAYQSADFLLLAESKEAMKIYLEQINLGNNIFRNAQLKKSFDNTFRTCSSIQLIRNSYLNDTLKSDTEKSNSFSCYAISNNGKQMLHNYLVGVESIAEVNAPIYSWRKELKEKISSLHALSYKNDSIRTIAAISDSKIYFFDYSGKLFSELTFPDTLQNICLEFTSKKSSNTYLVTASKNKIFMLDARGKMLNGFPIKIKSLQIKAITLLKGKNDEQRLLVQTTQSLQMFDLKGASVEGWNDPKFRSSPVSDVFRTKINDKVSYLYLGTDDNMHLIDSKGKNDKLFDSLTVDLKMFHSTQIDQSTILFYHSNVSYKYDVLLKKLSACFDKKQLISTIKYQDEKNYFIFSDGIFVSEIGINNLSLLKKHPYRLASLSLPEFNSRNDVLISEMNRHELLDIVREKVIWTGTSTSSPVFLPYFDSFQNTVVLTFNNSILSAQYLK